MTYAEFLKSQGASEEEIKILDTAVARRAYDKMQADATTAADEARKIRENAEAYEQRVTGWYENHEKEFKTMENKFVAAEAEKAKAVAALKTAHERGMIDVAKDLGYKFDEPVAPPARTEVPALDATKYFTREEVLQLAEREGEAIATVSDIAAEHVYLFGAPLRNTRELRKEAMARKISLEALWMEKYKVPEARAKKESDAKAADEARIRADEREKATAEFSSKYGNPETRPLTESRSFLIPRKESGREGKQPWDLGVDGEGGSNDRVKRAWQNSMKTSATH